MIRTDTLLALEGYVLRREPVGGFLTAVLSNQLMESYRYADADNLEHMMEIVRWVYNKVPEVAWGSPDRVKAWLKNDRT